MKRHLPLIFMLGIGVAACQQTPPTSVIVPPTLPVVIQNTATATTQPTITQTATVAATAAPSLTAKPASPTAAAPFQVTITPTAQTLPAGASATFFVSLSGKPPSQAPRWSVTGSPAGVITQFLPDASPANSTLVVEIPCALSRGTHSLNVQATISQTMQVAQAKLYITDRLVDSRSGSYTGSFAANTIYTRRGGPSTAQSGPFLVLQFCESVEPRTLAVKLQSAISDAGSLMTDPPRFTLFKSLVWPVPETLQTVSGGYRATAREVSNNDGWNLRWNINNGVYVLAFQRSPFDDSKPADKRPASVTYSVDILH